ncbi:hypothetical protein EG68_05732 [Paragonimus skrjabini miyazakii]|uniref:BZIP domain-containing protein n=1 Tax=Paragonimus skrjabini miyazakii TaxID=59628 RepID=A0A8S9YQ98_9TREM|nr:hypothetical protein EG68_05732 [Paragonimus skrjabini miyazakii]
MQSGFSNPMVNLNDIAQQNYGPRVPPYGPVSLHQPRISATSLVGNSYNYPMYENNLKNDHMLSGIPPSLPNLTAGNYGFCGASDTSVSSFSEFSVSSPHQLQTYTGDFSANVSSDGSIASSAVAKSKSRRRSKVLDPETPKLVETAKADDFPLSLSTKDDHASPLRVSSPSSTSDASRTVDSKDDRYLQRRLRNNMAAKRSRDNRKRREDTIALRASYLEKSNVVLQAQILALKKEICMLRGIPFDPNYRVSVSDSTIVSTSCEQLTPFFNPCVIPNVMPMSTLSCTPSVAGVNHYSPSGLFSGHPSSHLHK